jgi:hypothetical protein
MRVACDFGFGVGKERSGESHVFIIVVLDSHGSYFSPAGLATNG